MSSFFTASKSERKRKRTETGPETNKKRSRIPDTQPRKQKRDESISGSEDEDEADDRKKDQEEDDGSSSEDETAAERRLRLAEQYLEKIKGDVQEEVGFDAEEIDRDLIAERLQEDVSESKGRLHRFIAGDYDYESAMMVHFRTKAASVNAIAACPPYAYTVTRDAVVTKWQILKPPPLPKHPHRKPKKAQKPVRRRPIKVTEHTASNAAKDAPAHKAPILAVSASSNGKYVVTGAADRKIILYSTGSREELTPIKSFPQHRDIVTSLSFRPGSSQFFSASRDRTIKVWAAEERAYVETLFGHQDEVVDIASFPTVERCASVGARDRTARVWKVVEESQLIFRGGGTGGHDRKAQLNRANGLSETKRFSEGSIDRVAVIDNDTFVTGSDNGNLCLWALHKKKPLFTYSMAHGREKQMTAEECSAEFQLGPDFKLPERQPRWITALKTLPLSDLIITGSWDGEVRVWRIGQDKKSLESIGVIGKVSEIEDGSAELQGYINDLVIFERGERGKDGLCVLAAFGTQHRLGRWKRLGHRGGAAIWEIPRKAVPAKRASVAGAQQTREQDVDIV